MSTTDEDDQSTQYSLAEELDDLQNGLDGVTERVSVLEVAVRCSGRSSAVGLVLLSFGFVALAFDACRRGRQ